MKYILFLTLISLASFAQESRSWECIKCKRAQQEKFINTGGINLNIEDLSEVIRASILSDRTVPFRVFAPKAIDKNECGYFNKTRVGCGFGYKDKNDVRGKFEVGPAYKGLIGGKAKLEWK